jgi:hypothetical protein
MKTSILLFLIGIITISINKTVPGVEASTEFGAQEHACPPFNQEAYDYLVDFATYSFPHSYEGITAQAIPPEEIRWLEFHPKCAELTNRTETTVTFFRSNKYTLIVSLWNEHITFIDDETFTFSLMPSYIIVFDEDWVEIGMFLI